MEIDIVDGFLCQIVGRPVAQVLSAGRRLKICLILLHLHCAQKNKTHPPVPNKHHTRRIHNSLPIATYTTRWSMAVGRLPMCVWCAIEHKLTARRFGDRIYDPNILFLFVGLVLEGPFTHTHTFAYKQCVGELQNKIHRQRGDSTLLFPETCKILFYCIYANDGDRIVEWIRDEHHSRYIYERVATNID